SPAGWLLAATPALGFLVVVKLIMRRLPTDHAITTVPADEAAQVDQTPHPAPGPALGPAPIPVPRVRLPQPLVNQITVLVERIRDEGREPTADDIREAVKVPDEMAVQILASIPPAPTSPTSPINGHSVA